MYGMAIPYVNSLFTGIYRYRFLYAVSQFFFSILYMYLLMESSCSIMYHFNN
jgi:hypothetical protein